MENTKFSVAMSVYKNDNPDHFRRALESITDKQTVLPTEVVLVSDGPISDELNAVIDDYCAKYDIFNVIRLEKNGGLGNALRIAVENASNELIARMDSDDVAVPTRFEQQLRFMNENPDVDIVGSDISEFIDSEDNIVAYRTVPKSDAEIKEYIKTRCPFNHMTVMYKRSSVLDAGNYLHWMWNEDYYLWIRMYEKGFCLANMDAVLVNARVGKEMYQRRGGKKYYESEKALQKYMLENKVINKSTYRSNVFKRWVVQRLLPNKLRGWVFRKFARKSKKVDK